MSRPFPARLLAVSASVALVAGCVPPPAPPPPPAPLSSPVPAPPAPAPAADWQDWPVTAGDWRYERDARGSRALFGPAGGEALAVLRCDPGQRAIFVSRAGAGTGAFTIRTSSMTRTLTTQPTGGTPPYAVATLEPRDALLDAIAFTRGRFTIEQPGVPALVLRPWSEVSRVIEDCRG